MFYALSGAGSYLNGRRIKVSRTRNLADSVVGFGFPYDRSKARQVLQVAERVLVNCRDLKRSGPASLDIAYAASGRLEACFEPALKPWDIAAGMLFLQEAGGRITAWDGTEVPLGSFSIDILASNGLTHDSLLQHLKQTLCQSGSLTACTTNCS